METASVTASSAEAPFGKRIPSSLKNDAQRSPVFTFRLDGKSIAVDGARTAMNGQNRICHTVLHEW